MNRILKIFTGYRYEKKKMNGLDLHFSFKGKSIFFDPIEMLKEYKIHVSQNSVERIKTAVDLSEPLLDLKYPEVNDRPSVICECKKSGIDFKVSRYSLKDGVYPLSFYKFEMNDKLVGTFRRKYDNGSDTSSVALKLAQYTQTDINKLNENWVWKNDKDQCLFIMKFGHTQIWNFTDSDFFESKIYNM